MSSHSGLVRFHQPPSLSGSIRRFCVLALLALPCSASAWNAAGHRLVATIAWDQLGEGCRSEVSSILHTHPDYSRWLRSAARAGTGDLDRATFIESSTWPDDIRKDKRFYDADREAPTDSIQGFPDMARHRDWHFVNRPLDAMTSPTSPRDSAYGQLDRRLRTFAAQLDSRPISRAAQAYALPWLIHLVGDAHQPLHASARVDTPGSPERQMVLTPGYRSQPHKTTLHAFWDDLPGPPWLRGARLDAAIVDLLAQHARPAPSATDDWLEESWRLARDLGYPRQTGPQGELSPEFVEQSRQIADRRIVEAGFRQAELLNERLCRERPN